MQKDFYLELSDDIIALCERLLQRAAKWQLPIAHKGDFIGCGKIHGFYMFWIACKDGDAYFKARLDYTYGKTQGLVYYPLVAENEEAILRAAEVVYLEYLAHGAEVECQMAERSEKAKARRTAGTPITSGLWYGAVQRAVSRVSETSCECAVTDAELSPKAQAFSRAADRLLRLLCNEIRNERTRDSFQRYMLRDEETLEQIGIDYNVTRERIRQLVRRGEKEIAASFARQCVRAAEGESVDACIAEMVQAVEGISCDLLTFAECAFADWDIRKKGLALRLLLGEDNVAEQRRVPKKRREEKKAAAKALVKQDKILRQLDQLQRKICYPTAVYADTQERIDAFVPGKEYAYLARFRTRLEKLQDHLRILQKPNVVYYSSSRTDHRPDFLLELENGRRVLALVLPTLNMAFSYNVKRMRALRDFCERKGYGYLIIDDRDQTLADLKALPVDPALQDALDGILHSKGEIDWSDIQWVKKTMPLTHSLIAAYVLQNGLYLGTDPYFRICSFSSPTVENHTQL